jgi:hypothetical protein
MEILNKQMEFKKFSCKFSRYYVGLSNGNISDDGQWIPPTQSYYYFGSGSDYCTLDKNKHIFEWPNGTIKPIWNGRRGDIIGCGLVLSPNNQLAIFFTLNGILLGQFLPWAPFLESSNR